MGSDCERELAEVRASDLLRSKLSRKEAEEYHRDGCLIVPSRLHVGRVYRLRLGQRPVVVENGMDVHELCVHAYDLEENYLPRSDQVLAQKILIEGAELRFLSVATPQSIRG